MIWVIPVVVLWLVVMGVALILLRAARRGDQAAAKAMTAKPPPSEDPGYR